LKAAVVGLGIGMAHVAGYIQSPDTELYAVCDLMPERLSKVGGTFNQGSMLCLRPLISMDILGNSWEEIGVKTFSSLDELLEDDAIDIISICTPDYLHAEHAEKVIKAGKHLLLEKPIDINNLISLIRIWI
jgi:UDP-N-acetyl-2-amino-2-deoxyglucuronate dehydrogenase